MALTAPYKVSALRAMAIVGLTIFPIFSRNVAAQSAASAEDQAYDAAIRDALTQFDAGKLNDAKALFQRAHELRPSARTFRALGFTEYELGHYAAALELLAAARSDERDALSAEQLQELDRIAAYANARVGRFVIERRPAEATMIVDGRVVELAQSQPLVLDVGAHRVEVSAPGYHSETRELQVKGAAQQTLRFALIAEPAVASTASSAMPLSAAPAATPQTQSSSLRTWGWVSVGAAALTLGGSIVAWRIGEAAASRWNDDLRCLVDGKTREQNCASDRDASNTARTWTIVGLSATVALAATATILLWPKETAEIRSDRSAQRARCAAGPGELGVACVLRF